MYIASVLPALPRPVLTSQCPFYANSKDTLSAQETLLIDLMHIVLLQGRKKRILAHTQSL